MIPACYFETPVGRGLRRAQGNWQIIAQTTVIDGRQVVRVLQEHVKQYGPIRGLQSAG